MAIPVSPNIVSGRVVATIIFSSVGRNKRRTLSSVRTPLTGTLNLICKARQHTKLKLFLNIISRNIEQCPAFQLLLVDFEVGQRSVELNTPVDEAVGAIDHAVLMQSAKGFNDSFAKFLAQSIKWRLRVASKTYLVHGESDTIPVITAAKAVQLVRYAPLVAGGHEHHGIEWVNTRTQSSSP